MNPVKLTLVWGFVLLGAANFFFALLTVIIKAQKYGLADIWQNPDGFALVTCIIGLCCLGVAYWFYKK